MSRKRSRSPDDLQTKTEASVDNAEVEDGEFTVSKVTQNRIVKLPRGQYRTEFRVKWDGHPQLTWEPMENLADNCCHLFEDLEKSGKQKFAQKIGKTSSGPHELPASTALRSFAVIPSVISSGFTNSIEFIPKGTEEVKHIAQEITRDNCVFWLVSFSPSPNLAYVRKCVMEYYFPTASSYFHKYLKSKKVVSLVPGRSLMK